MLSTKHQGGVAGRARNPFEEASNLLNNPKENFQDEATISTQNGKVESVSKTALNDHEIAINGVNHFVSRIQDPTVSVGDSVKIGDPLSTGTINPRELVGLKGSGAGRVYISNKMRSIYSRDTSLDPKHFDVIARNMVKHVVITDPGTSGFLPGDTVEIGQLNKYYNENNEEVPLEKAEGKVLAKGSLELTPGTLLSKNHIEYLKGEGVSKVKVDKDGLKVNPIVPGLQTNKLLDKNWVSRLSFSHLGKSIQEAASLSESSPIHSTDPIAPYLVGREFGEGERGRY
jgi:DNA-directed RNA polymerase subunit beta'